MEFAHFGWNAMTISFLGTVFGGLFQMWGIKGQSDSVWRSTDGASVSVPRFVGLVTYAFAALIYGLAENKFALLLDGLFLVPFACSTTLGLWFRKGFTRCDSYWLFVSFASVAVMTITEHKALWYFVISVFSYLMSCDQPLEIARNKKRGVVSIRMICTNACCLVFWSIYTLVTRDRVLMIMVPLYDLRTLATLALWVNYPNPQPV